MTMDWKPIVTNWEFLRENNGCLCSDGDMTMTVLCKEEKHGN